MLQQVVAVTLVASLCGCGGGSSPPPSATTTTVTGVVAIGSPYTIIGGTYTGPHVNTGWVDVYDFSSGSKAALLAQGQTVADGSGRYTLSYTTASPPSAILVEATDECYLEAAYQWEGVFFGAVPQASATLTPQFGFAPVCGDSQSPLDAVTAVVPGSTASVAVTPYTHAALGLIQYQIRNGTPVTTAITDATASFTQLLGFNPVTTLPVMPLPVESTNNATIYGGLIAAIPGWLYNVAYVSPSNTTVALLGTPGLRSLDFAEAMRSDLAEDGVLNGTGRNAAGNATPLSIVGVPLATDVYRHGLAEFTVEQLRGPFEYVSTVADTQQIIPFLPALVAYNDATVLFDGSPITPLDENYPQIKLVAPTAGAVLSGDAGVNGYIPDIVGIALAPSIPANCVLLVDGAYYDSFNDPYHPNDFVNTTVFPNGSHTLTIKVTNNLGTTTSASVAVTFSN